MKKFSIGDTVWVYESYLLDSIHPAEVVAVDEKEKIAMVKINDFNYDEVRFKNLFKTRNAAIDSGIRYEERCIKDHQRTIDRLRKRFEEV